MLAREVTKKSSPARPKAFRWLFVAVGLLFGLGICIVILFGAWFVRSLHKFEALFADAQSTYQTLNARFPFAPPSVSETVPAERFDAYFRIRGKLLEPITPRTDALAAELLKDTWGTRIKTLRLMRDGYDALGSAMRAHQVALQLDQMSLNEYLWIHGLLVRDILGKDGDDARGRILRETLAQLEQLEKSNESREKNFTAKDYVAGLEEGYRSYAPAPAATSDKLEIKRISTSLLDLFAANRDVMRAYNLDSTRAGAEIASKRNP